MLEPKSTTTTMSAMVNNPPGPQLHDGWPVTFLLRKEPPHRAAPAPYTLMESRRRGLTEIGIKRLCGAMTAREMWFEKFKLQVALTLSVVTK